MTPTDTSDVLKSIVIPSCPKILADLRAEISRDDADDARLARLVGSDAALSLAVLRTVNSPFYGLSRQIDSVSQAVAVLGMTRLSALVGQVMVRQALVFPGVNLVRFWDSSEKRSIGMRRLAKEIKGVDTEQAQSFGLFCDIGIPLLMHRYPNYGQTLKLANEAPDDVFTAVEFEHHGIDHARIGFMMVKAWGLGETMAEAIKRHHDYSVFLDAEASQSVQKLIAMLLVTEHGIDHLDKLGTSREWGKGGEYAMGTLMLNEQDVEDCVDMVIGALSVVA